MSTPAQPMMGGTIRAEITQFVAEVEKALSDLPADDVAELTDGLEADLTEAWAAEGTTPTQRFGSPQAYAADLRSAAGIPVRAASRPAYLQNLRTELEALRQNLFDLPGAPTVLAYARQLQPAWWVVRAPLALILVAGFVIGLPGDALTAMVVLSLILAVVSMRWGSAVKATGPLQVLLYSWNIVAVIGLLLFPVIFDSYYISHTDAAAAWSPVNSDRKGLYLGDQPVTNVFAYDQNGKPLTRIRLYDQDGKPLSIDSDEYETNDSAGNYVKTTPDGGDGPAEWNLYPLLTQTQTQQQLADDQPYGPLVRATPPYQEVTALPPSLVSQPQPSVSATPSATPTQAR